MKLEEEIKLSITIGKCQYSNYREIKVDVTNSAESYYFKYDISIPLEEAILDIMMNTAINELKYSMRQKNKDYINVPITHNLIRRVEST